MNRLLAVCLLLIPAAVFAAPPPTEALIERISLSLGGAQGGAAVLASASSYDFRFERTVRESHSSREVRAKHRLLLADGGERRRLDIRPEDGGGRPSATVADRTGAWIYVDGGVHAVEKDAVLARLVDFDPARLFAVPLTLAVDGRRLLGEADLSVSETSGETPRYVLSGRDAEGESGTRIEVDARDYRPLLVEFDAPGGRISYRYADYREVARGLVLPFEREFYRNGVRLDRLVIERFDVNPALPPDVFARQTVDLPEDSESIRDR